MNHTFVTEKENYKTFVFLGTGDLLLNLGNFFQNPHFRSGKFWKTKH